MLFWYPYKLNTRETHPTGGKIVFEMINYQHAHTVGNIKLKGYVK